MATSQHSSFLSSFIGRRKELLEVRHLVETQRLVTLFGVGGVGKTRLGHQVFDDLAPAYPSAAWTVDLTDLVEASLLAHVFSASVGVPAPADGQDPRGLIDFFGTRPVLLYVDNCEHLLEACAQFVSALLVRCPGLRVLTSSRQALGVLGERVYPVPPLGDDDALMLFADRAVSVLPSWALVANNRNAVVELCSALDRVPLAIELAAVQIRTFTPAAMVSRLRDRRSIVGAPLRGERARRSSLDACIQWSHDLCTPAEQRLWERLSVFGGGFSLDAVEAACSGDGLEANDVFTALAGLVDKSLMERDPDDAEGRYRMLEVIRQYGMARLERSGTVTDWRRRHRDYYLTLAERFDEEWTGPRQAGWMDRFRLEHVNLRLAFDFSVSEPAEAPKAMRMSTVLEHYFASTGGGPEAVHWLKLALGHPTGTPRERASALRVGTFIATLLGDLVTASAWHGQMVPLAEETGDDLVLAYTFYAGSFLATFQGDPASGELLAAQGTPILRRLGDVSREANLHFLRGMMLGWCDRPDEAAAAYQACFDLAEPRGERWLTSYAQWGLGVDAFGEGDLDEALRLEREALRAKFDFGDQLGIALAMECIAWVAAAQRRGKDAAVLLGATSTIYEAIGMTVASMPYLARRREEGMAATRALLSPAEYDEFVEHGRALPQSEAVAIAIGQARVGRARRESVLTRREREIAELVALGMSNKAVAEQLVISVRTVETHVENILRKLEIESRGQVAMELSAQ